MLGKHNIREAYLTITPKFLKLFAKSTKLTDASVLIYTNRVYRRYF